MSPLDALPLLIAIGLMCASLGIHVGGFPTDTFPALWSSLRRRVYADMYGALACVLFATLAWGTFIFWLQAPLAAWAIYRAGRTCRTVWVLFSAAEENGWPMPEL